MDLGSCWVLEADIEDFFGSVAPAQLREILRQRVPKDRLRYFDRVRTIWKK